VGSLDAGRGSLVSYSSRPSSTLVTVRAAVEHAANPGEAKAAAAALPKILGATYGATQG
jgi:hypothetical protein